MKKMMVVIFYIGLMMPLARAGQSPVVGEDENLTRMRTQVESQRRKEEELQLLQMDVERLKLEVEKKKAVAELGQLSGGGQGSASLTGAGPSVVLKYIFISAGDKTRKEAVFDVNGVQSRAREGGDVGGRLVKAIAAQGVTLQAKDGQEERFTLKE